MTRKELHDLLDAVLDCNSSQETATTRKFASSFQSGSASYTASSSRMHGLHEVDQKDMIIGVPASRSEVVSNDSPLEFSTVTEGTCAAAIAEMNSARLRRIALIFIRLFT